MPDIRRVRQQITGPATLKVGGTSATEITEVIHGTVAFVAAGSIAAGAVSAISAAVDGLTANHKVVLFPIDCAASEYHMIVAAVGVAGGIQVTAQNFRSAASGGLNNRSCNFFAWK